MPNIRSLNDLRKDEKRNKEHVAHYTGGQKSGLEVENSDSDDMAQSYYTSKLPENCRRITLYKNGFTIDEGEFRDFEVEENKKFMENIEAGILPKELQGKDKSIMNVAIKDKSSQIYTKNKSQEEKTLYKGQGVKLGSSNSNLNEEEINKIIASNPTDIKEIKIDDNNPITTIQIRLYNGKKIIQKFNYNHTVEDLFQFVYGHTPINFSLFFDFPLKKIERNNKTLQEENLLGVIITQKL
ncbi:hypothetical protein, variant 1 [Plasmodium yoelii 17X]|uniref:Ubiquitin regulatory protein n=5 Tax=Plasmodium yoelii TaxID=5861 RepID=A0AAE9WZE9_PLAYO|nr:ubiquitin regulatory protein, putative [Plasmodium yoelii]ETB62248.1 hypothetical protein YYC_00861 [Plasmodium yoelii 17X]WBY59267.1 ubiquitin regulatory protein [Plasmodium yoelii yoelii]ETB62249.1 hypothetical protein, variant 1 [Plasmodium yoelii 17X]CDU19422.1 ubiquitin regulatory protein, putative [Plasmodium yoelii]VTZ80057.1 ubiquitin regulatory protein, putative [Plasmodium yoelii]|eukprot:XP_022812645.1 ubiquitin regulatory protein, putative [Plasmodium yoelii]